MTRRDVFLGLCSVVVGTPVARATGGVTGIVAVDTHAHVFTRALTLAGDRRYAPGYDAPIADYLAMLDQNGMSHGVLVQPSFLGTDNAYLVEALRAAPERLRGIAVVAPEADEDELEALSRVGVVGIRLNLIGQPDPAFGAAVWERHLARVVALGWQIEVQAEARRLPALIPPLLRAGVPVVVDHFGRPDPRLGVDDPGFRYLLETATTGQVWVKLSGAYRNGGGEAGERTALAAAEQLRAAFGPARLVWGSDWPHTQFEAVANPAAARWALDAWVPDEAARRTVLADTPARLFRFNG
jgi:predicted TIM-barrel fold metal-dependent hydrolase